MSRTLFLSLCAVLQAGIALVGFYSLKPRIEEDLIQRVSTGLGKSLGSLTISASGRDIDIRLPAEDAGRKQEAERLALLVFGVRRAVAEVSPGSPPISTPSVAVDVSKGEITSPATSVGTPTLPAERLPDATNQDLIRNPGANQWAALTLHFDFDEDHVASQSMSVLEDVIQELREIPDEKMSITGHADSTGPSKYNDALGLRRAQSVLENLVRAGLSRDRFSVSSEGESHPIASNATKEGRRLNRRVEIRPKGN